MVEVDIVVRAADPPGDRPDAGVGLTFGSKIAAAAIAVVTAAVALAQDQDRFAFTTPTIAFCAVVGAGRAALVRQARISTGATR